MPSSSPDSSDSSFVSGRLSRTSSFAPSIASSTTSTSSTGSKSSFFGKLKGINLTSKNAPSLPSSAGSLNRGDSALSQQDLASPVSSSIASASSKSKPVKAPAPVFVGGGRGGRGVRIAPTATASTGSLGMSVSSPTSSKPALPSAPAAGGGGRGGRGAVKMASISSTTSASGTSAASSSSGMPEDPEEDKLVSFPGWATLVRQDGELSLDVYTHGYAYRQVSLSNASGAGRIFYALAKSFAGLPKLPVTSGAATPVETPSLASADLSSRQGEEVFEHLLEVGGREGTVDETVELANATIAAVDGTLPITPIAITATSPSLSSSAASASYFPSRAASVTSLPSISSRRDTVDSEAWPVAFPPPSFSREQLAQFHKNVHSRLLPFLGIKLPERRVRITIYPAVGSDVLARTYLTTSAPGGGWTTSLKIKGAELATLLSSAGGDEEVKIRVLAELIEPEKVTYVDIPVPESASQMVGGGRGGRAATAAAPTKQAVPAPEGWEETAMVTATDSVALTVGGKEKEAEGGKIRVVSDVDDTVKWTEITKGTKTIFRNCFVRELADVRVPGMSSWYRDLKEEHSAHFHYVSNSPWELFPVIRSFLNIQGFPGGSCALKMYGGATSTLAKLWEEPGARKRASVEKVLIEFPDSKFFLVGDSGEQDMQLYCSLASDYPSQILAIYIRDVTTPFTPPSVAGAADSRPDLSRWTSYSSDVASFVMYEEPEEDEDAFDELDGQLHDLDFSEQGQTSSSGSSIRSRLSLSSPSACPHSHSTSPSLTRQTTMDSTVTMASVVDKATAVEAFLKRVEDCRAKLPEGITLRIFRSGDEVKAECDAIVRRALLSC